MNRFILCSEGRIDHLSGYLDGMDIWRKLHDEGNITGVIRGDEGFGWTQVSSELTVKLSVGCALCADFDNLKKVADVFKLPTQELPPELGKQKNESLCAWRDRLYHSYRLPTILAALSEIRFSYVEQINPLLSRTILTAVRATPDSLRTDKSLFKEIVHKIGPDVPFASKVANAEPEGILRSKPIVDVIKRELGSSYAGHLLGQDFVDYICRGMKEVTPGPKSRRKEIKKRIGSLLPQFVKNWLRDKAIAPRVDGNVLAFRAFIILKTYKILEADAAKFSR